MSGLRPNASRGRELETEQDLLRLLCATREVRERNAATIASLSSGVHAPLFLAEAQRQRLLTLAIERLDEAGQPAIREAGGEQLERAILGSHSRGAALELVAGGVSEVLDRASVRSLPLKGPLFASRVLGDAGLRDSSDVDLLVSADELGVAVEVISSQLGYQAVNPVRAGRLPPLHAELERGASGVPLEVHWRLHWYESRFAAAMLERAVPAEGCLRPQPEDELLALLLFFARDGFVGLRLAADISAWWDRYGAEVSLPRVTENLRRFPELSACASIAAQLAESWVGVPIASLGEPGVARSRRQIALRLANWRGIGTRGQIAAAVHLVDCALAPAAGLPGAVRRSLFPHASELEALQSTGEGGKSQLTRLRARAVHLVKTLCRFGIALFKPRGRSGAKENPIAQKTRSLGRVT